MRLWSTIPASSRIDRRVVLRSGACPLSARATRASRVSVRPARAGLSAPSRSAVEPDTAIAEHLTAAELLGAGGRVDHDTLPGTRRADEYRQALRARQGLAGRAAARRRGVRRCTPRPPCSRSCLARSPTSRPAGSDEHARACARSPAPARGPRASSFSRPPASGCAARRPSGASRAIACAGSKLARALLKRDRTQQPRRRTPPRARSASPRSGPPSPAPAAGAAGHRLDAPPHPHRTRDAHPLLAQTRCRSPRVASSFARRFSSAMSRISPRSGARPCFARKRSAACAISR